MTDRLEVIKTREFGPTRADADWLVAEVESLRLERDQLSRDASDARRQLGIARASIVRMKETSVRKRIRNLGWWLCGTGPRDYGRRPIHHRSLRYRVGSWLLHRTAWE